MFCNNCGNEIDDNAMICPHCGVATNNTPEPINPMPVAKKTNVCAIIGFVLSLISGTLSYIPVVGFFISLAAIIAAFVLSIIGLKNVKKGQNLKALAIVGLVFSSIDLFWVVIGFIVGLVLLG